MTVRGRGFMRLCVIMAGFARRFLDDGFPVFRSSHIHRFNANEKDFSLCSKWRCGGTASWDWASLWLALLVGFRRVSRFSFSAYTPFYRKQKRFLALPSRWAYIYTIHIGTVKRHRISALLPEGRPRKAAALRGVFTSIIYVYNIFPYAYSMEIV